MDELEISGKRYISSHRAAREHGYTQDYVGQLIRSGKIKGQKVGRAWYVDKSSLNEYLGSNPAEQVPQEQLGQQLQEPEQQTPEKSLAQAPPSEGGRGEDTEDLLKEIAAKDILEPESKVVHIEISKSQNFEPPVRPPYEIHGGLRYLEEESILPEIDRPVKSVRRDIESTSSVENRKISKPKIQTNSRRIFSILPWAFAALLTVTAAGAASLVTYRISAEEGGAASTALAFPWQEYSASFWKTVNNSLLNRF